jgi:hypothetical protein
MACFGVDCALKGTIERSEVDNRTRDAMWISLFTLACGAAVCLSVAAILMERGGQPLRR